MKRARSYTPPRKPATRAAEIRNARARLDNLARHPGAEAARRPYLPDYSGPNQPQSRTVLERKAYTAPYHVIRLVQRPDWEAPIARFHCGCASERRALFLVDRIEDRAIVSKGGAILFDNRRPYAPA